MRLLDAVSKHYWSSCMSSKGKGTIIIVLPVKLGFTVVVHPCKVMLLCNVYTYNISFKVPLLL